MDDQLVLFVDILGFREAAEHPAEDQQTKLIELLRNLALLQTNATVEQTPTETQMKAAVTTFSDHVVVSYPMTDLRKLGDTIPLQIGMHNVKRVVAGLAAEIARLGLLVRGGVTVGRLYHSDRVVLGEAMNEAYKLESQVAIYPRVAVSRKVYGEIGVLPSAKLFLNDRDGITHLNYFEHMIQSAGNPPGRGHDERSAAWLAAVRHNIAENIALFEQKEDWKKLAKWAWFKKELDDAESRLSINSSANTIPGAPAS